MDSITGKQFGVYQVLSLIGQGGMATIYKAYQSKVDRYVALKVLPHQFARETDFIERFNQESKVVAQLLHPHILPVFDFGESEGYTYMVMPYIEGGTLSQVLQGKPLPFKQIRYYISQICEALDYAHGLGVIHRDIKPSNILLDERGNCFLTDFGIAKILASTSHFTASGNMIGTPSYMSPEQGRGEKIDQRSDIYSLGIILYEMVTGKKPFDAETPAAIMMKHILDPLIPPREINPLIPEPLERVILKALAKEPDNRFTRASEMMEALQAAIPEQLVSQDGKSTQSYIASELSVSKTEANTASPSEKALPKKKKNIYWVIASFATIACIGLIAIGFIAKNSFFPSEVVNNPAAEKLQFTSMEQGNLPAVPSTQEIQITNTIVSEPNITATSIPKPIVLQDIETINEEIKMDSMVTETDADGWVYAVWNYYADGPKLGSYVAISPEGQIGQVNSFTIEFDRIGNLLQLTINPQGQVCLFFSSSDDWYRRCFEQGKIGEIEKIANDSSLTLAFAYDSDGTTQYIRDSRIHGGQAILFGDVILSEDALFNDDLQFQIDPTGRYHLVWHQMTDDAFLVMYSASSDQGITWSPPMEISKIGSSLITGPIVKQNQQGELSMLYASSQLVYRKWTEKSGWSGFGMLAEGYDPRFISMALGPDGLPHVIWHEYQGMYYIRQLVDGTWTEPAMIHDSLINNLEPPQIAVNDDGIVYVFWSERNTDDEGVNVGRLP